MAFGVISTPGAAYSAGTAALASFRQKTHRLIASRWPTIGVFDDLVPADDIPALLELELASNDRLTGALGRLQSIPRAEWAIGKPGAHYAMAAFLHPSPDGARFNTAVLGAWYASLDVTTALTETRYHHTRKLAASSAGFPARIQMRELVSSPDCDLVDIRPEYSPENRLYEKADYAMSQSFGEKIRAAQQDGIWFTSVRRPEGENIVLFKPRLIPPVRQANHFEYAWDHAGNCGVARLTDVNLA